MFTGLYIFISIIFLFFSVMNFSMYLVNKQRKMDIAYGFYFLFMFFSYAAYSLFKGNTIGGFNNLLGYVFDGLAVTSLLVGLFITVKENKEYFDNLFKGSKK
jgi:hypothetical protein